MKNLKWKQVIWSVVVSAVLTMIIGFALGGWVTGGTAQEMAKEMTENAVIERLAPIAVAQFLQDPDKVKFLEELKKLSSWDRGSFIEKQGWAKMPGEEKPDRLVVDKLTSLLVELKL